MSPHRPIDEKELKRSILEDENRIANLDERLEIRMLRITDDHEGRIRDMEKWQHRMMGLGLLAGFVMTFLTGIATWIVTDDIRALRQQLAPASSGRSVR